jgi:hypothetical protein
VLTALGEARAVLSLSKDARRAPPPFNEFRVPRAMSRGTGSHAPTHVLTVTDTLKQLVYRREAHTPACRALVASRAPVTIDNGGRAS